MIENIEYELDEERKKAFGNVKSYFLKNEIDISKDGITLTIKNEKPNYDLCGLKNKYIGIDHNHECHCCW